MAITFQFHYPIERTMAFEKEYHPNLRLSLEEKRDLLLTRSAISAKPPARPSKTCRLQ